MDKFVSVEQVNMAFKTKQGSFMALKDINLALAKANS